MSDDIPCSQSAANSGSAAAVEEPVKVEGELSIRNADGLRALFAESLERSHDLALDLSGIRTCDAAGLQLIWSLRRSAVERGRRVRTSRVSAVIESTAAALGLPIQEFEGAPGENGRGV